MPPQKTHREVKSPRISARHLAEYMAATETAKRTIVRACKYQPIARVIQHDEARAILSKFVRAGQGDVSALHKHAGALRERLADSDFERDLFDHNADYIDRFASVQDQLNLPKATRLAPGSCPPVNLHGVRVTVEVHFRLQRLTKTNKVRIGAGMLRYAKGKAQPEAVCQWQSAFLYGYLKATNAEEAATAEEKLCVTIDAYAGVYYPAPTDSTRRFKNMMSACETIAERWPNIKPPPNAVL